MTKKSTDKAASSPTAASVGDTQQLYSNSPAAAWSPQQQLHDSSTTASSKASAGLPASERENNKPKPPASLLKQIVTKNHQQAVRDDKHRGSPRAPRAPQSTQQQPQTDVLEHDLIESTQELTHDGNNASIVLNEQLSIETPWTPKSLGRAKTAIIYKQTLNDTLLVRERNIFFFSEWVPHFVSLQDDYMLLFKSRERWEQGLKPDKIIELHHMLLLGDMKVDVDTADASRLFRRKLLETDELDEWLNEELRQHLVVGAGSQVGSVLSTNPHASARCVLEFASYNQSTFELWTKSIRRVLQAKREQHCQATSPMPSSSFGAQRRASHDDGDDFGNHDGSSSVHQHQANNASPTRHTLKKAWVSPGQDSRLTLHQSEIWCHRVLSGEKEKAESEIRRIVAMEKLVAQVTSPRMALLVYEKVSRVHELFVANSRREIERLDARAAPLSSDVLHFFADHLKRKYSVFLILALAYGVGEEQIRDAHETMCLENAAVHAGVGGGSGELERPAASAYGFDDAESVELYEKYRDAAVNYHKMNYGDGAAAEEEDAIMHLPVMLQVAVVRRDHDEVTAMLAIMQTIKTRLAAHCVEQENDA